MRQPASDYAHIIERAERLVPTLAARARKTEELRRIPDETIADLQGSGLIRLLQPVCYGGAEAPVQTYFDVVMALSAADASAGWVYSVFAVHAWLANWDAVGIDGSNVGTTGGKPVNLDLGGSLLYRAQGQPKGDKFDAKASEWTSLRSPSTNLQPF